MFVAAGRYWRFPWTSCIIVTHAMQIEWKTVLWFVSLLIDVQDLADRCNRGGMILASNAVELGFGPYNANAWTFWAACKFLWSDKQSSWIRYVCNKTTVHCLSVVGNLEYGRDLQMSKHSNIMGFFSPEGGESSVGFEAPRKSNCFVNLGRITYMFCRKEKNDWHKNAEYIKERGNHLSTSLFR